jgi:hypothetical protein
MLWCREHNTVSTHCVKTDVSVLISHTCVHIVARKPVCRVLHTARVHVVAHRLLLMIQRGNRSHSTGVPGGKSSLNPTTHPWQHSSIANSTLDYAFTPSAKAGPSTVPFEC